MVDIFFHASLNTCIYNVSFAFQWFDKFVYTPLNYCVNLSIKWPIYTALNENWLLASMKWLSNREL